MFICKGIAGFADQYWINRAKPRLSRGRWMDTLRTRTMKGRGFREKGNLRKFNTVQGKWEVKVTKGIVFSIL